MAGDACGRLKKFDDRERDALKALKRLWGRDGFEDVEDGYMMLKYLTMGADKGSALAMRLLGNRDLETSVDNMSNTELAKDKELYKNHKQDLLERKASAFKWFLAAAEKGDVTSMRQLASSYDNGVGTEKNDRLSGMRENGS